MTTTKTVRKPAARKPSRKIVDTRVDNFAAVEKRIQDTHFNTMAGITVVRRFHVEYKTSPVASWSQFIATKGTVETIGRTIADMHATMMRSRNDEGALADAVSIFTLMASAT